MEQSKCTVPSLYSFLVSCVRTAWRMAATSLARYTASCIVRHFATRCRERSDSGGFARVAWTSQQHPATTRSRWSISQEPAPVSVVCRTLTQWNPLGHESPCPLHHKKLCSTLGVSRWRRDVRASRRMSGGGGEKRGSRVITMPWWGSCHAAGWLGTYIGYVVPHLGPTTPEGEKSLGTLLDGLLTCSGWHFLSVYPYDYNTWRGAGTFWKMSLNTMCIAPALETAPLLLYWGHQCIIYYGSLAQLHSAEEVERAGVFIVFCTR